MSAVPNPIDGLVGEDADFETTPFRINDDEQGNWAMRKYADIRREIDRIEAIAAAEIARVKEWADGETERARRRLSYFDMLITDYAHRQRAEHDRKTIHLIGGSVATRVTAGKWDIDAERFVRWAEERQRVDLLKTEVKPALQAIKDALQQNGAKAVDPATGETVDGITIGEPTVRTTINTGKTTTHNEEEQA